MLKRFLCVLLVLLCLLSCALAEEYPDGFLFMNAIHWNTTADEAAAVLGEGVQRNVEHDPELGSAEVLVVDDTELAGHSVQRMIVQYYEDRLYYIMCYFSQTEVGDAQALAEGLSSFLGEPERHEEDSLGLDAFILEMTGSRELYSWKNGDVTEASLMFVDAQQLYGLTIENTAVGDMFKQALADAGYFE